MSWALSLLLIALAGCSSARTRSDASASGTTSSADGSPELAADGGQAEDAHMALQLAMDGGARPVAADAGELFMEEDAGTTLGLDCSELTEVPESAEPLVLELPKEPPIGLPFALSVATRSGAPISGPVMICARGAVIARLQLYRGRGSASLRVQDSGALQLEARGAAAYGSKTVALRARPQRHYQTASDAGSQTISWSAAEDVVIEGVQRVAVNQQLTIGPGTRVLFGANAVLSVTGELRVQGSAEDPVLFTRAGEQAWGSVHIVRGARASLDHAWFVAGGGDVSRPFGHSDSQPVLLVDASSLEMRGGGLIDNPGKAFGSNKARVQLDATLISRCDTGGQFQASQLMFRHLHVLELPDADGQPDDDDNDGLYIFQALDDDAGVDSVIEDSVFAVGEDDAIDHNGAQLRLERVWIQGFRHEGVACSSGRDVQIRDSVVRDCAQGIEAGYGTPHVRVEGSLVTGNGVGVRYGDGYAWETHGTLTVSHSIVAGNDVDVRNYVELLMAPQPDALRVTCSVVDDAQLAGSAGNVLAPASQPWAASACSAEPVLDPQACGRALAGPPCW